MTPEAASDVPDGPEEILLLGPSSAARRLRTQVDRIARTPGTTLLVTGEVGMDAAALARALHARSDAALEIFEARDAAGLRSLGSRTHGSEPARAGAGGTFFLEEVAALDPALQEGLLAWLDRPDHGPRRTRVVASTSTDLEEEVRAGNFLPDLLYRLNVLTLRLPPLRERAEDLPSMTRALLDSMKRKVGSECELAPRAAELIAAHPWPGNSIELESLLRLACLRAMGSAITPELLSRLGVEDPQGDALIPQMPALRSLRDLEEAAIRRALSTEKGNRSGAARALGIHRQTLYNKMRLYGIR